MSNPNKNAPDFASLIKDKFTMRKDIAPVETSATASRAYKVGEKFYYGNLLREATQDIAQGGTLTLNTNYKNADPVTTTIQNLSTVISKNGAKNLLPFDLGEAKVNNTAGTWSGDSYIRYGVTITPIFDSEGTLLYFNVDGTATDNVFFKIVANYKLPKGDYILSGTPTGGSSNTYYMSGYLDNNVYKGNDIGAGKPFTVNSDYTPNSYDRIEITVISGATVSNIKFYPMIRLASDTDPTYQPYAKTNQQLTKETTGLIDNQNVNGAKNLLPFDLANIKKINTSGTWSGNSYTHSGVTFTPEVDDKGNLLYVNVNGTNPSSTITASVVFWNSDVSPFYLQPNNYILTGTPSGGGHNTYNCYVKNGSNYEVDLGNGKEFTISSASQGLAFVIGVGKGQTVNNIKYYPMIRLASDPDATYEPYAMGNRELTQAVSLKNVYGNPQGNTSGTLRCMIRAGVVCFGADLNISATISANTVLAINLPPNIDLNNRILLFSSSGQYLAKVDADGQLIATTEIPSGYYRIVGSYITT